MSHTYHTICRRFRAGALAVGLAAVSWSCMNEERVDLPASLSAEPFAFEAVLDNGNSIATRFGEKLPITPTDFGETVFYIYERGSEKKNDVVSPRAELRPYWLASGTLGQLDITPYHGSEECLFPTWASGIAKEAWELNWFAADTEHRFWSWTWPLAEPNYEQMGAEYAKVKLPSDPEVTPGSQVIIFYDSDFPLKETETATPDDAPEVDETPLTPQQAWRNGEALERLVGTKTDRAYVFNQHGRYVPLTYKHLVSKIILGNFWLRDNTGAMQKDLAARITFYGLPKRAMFYPYPNTKDTAEGETDQAAAPYVIIDHSDPYGTEKAPTVLTPEEEAAVPFDAYKLGQYLTFYILNKGRSLDNTGGSFVPDEERYEGHDMFYICPEVDFNRLEYKVEFVEYNEKTNTYVPHSRYGIRGGYFGDFKNVEFKRQELTSDVDEEGNPIYKETIDHTLHAGEVMVLNMTVYEKSGPGVGVWIRNWDNEKLKSATHHLHKGIYSDAEAAAVRTAFGSADASYNERKKHAAELYGEWEQVEHEDGTVTEELVIRMYSDISIACVSSDPNYASHFYYYLYDLTTADKLNVVLDGMGYTLSFVDSYASHEPHEYFRIGNVRDLYITNGVSTIYIDSEGYICRLNEETGKYERGEEPEKLQPNQKTYFEKQ